MSILFSLFNVFILAHRSGFANKRKHDDTNMWPVSVVGSHEIMAWPQTSSTLPSPGGEAATNGKGPDKLHPACKRVFGVKIASAVSKNSHCAWCNFDRVGRKHRSCCRELQYGLEYKINAAKVAVVAGVEGFYLKSLISSRTVFGLNAQIFPYTEDIKNWIENIG